jgi:hypothetical protein
VSRNRFLRLESNLQTPPGKSKAKKQKERLRVAIRDFDPAKPIKSLQTIAEVSRLVTFDLDAGLIDQRMVSRQEMAAERAETRRLQREEEEADDDTPQPKRRRSRKTRS